jgi:hypothetical protein
MGEGLEEREGKEMSDDRPIVKWKTCSWSTDIQRVEVDRETEASVFRGGFRHAKRSSAYSYFDTWEDARDSLLEREERNLALARRKLESAQGAVGNIKGLKPPIQPHNQGAEE